MLTITFLTILIIIITTGAENNHDNLIWTSGDAVQLMQRNRVFLAAARDDYYAYYYLWN